MLSKWKKDYREGKLKPAAEAAGLLDFQAARAVQPHVTLSSRKNH
jgi:hypothetical protein